MSIEITPLTDDEDWNDHVRAARSDMPFHLAESLDIFESYADADCHRLVGYKGNEVVGLFPVFTRQVGPVTAAFSPPPNLKIQYLGPVFCNVQKLKRRRRELRTSRFIDAAVEWLDETHDPVFTHVRTTPGYADVRPFIWKEYDVVPRYTYIVDLDRDPDDLLQSFSSDARRNITGDHEVDYTIAVGGRETIRKIVDQVTVRHEEQGEPFPIGAAFVTDLYESLPEDVIQPYYCEVDGEFIGGKISVEFDGRSTSWLGGAKTSHDLPVNDLLEWRFLTDGMERGATSYDLAGANDRRLSRYKAKYAPELTPYFRLENGSWGARRAASLYKRVR